MSIKYKGQSITGPSGKDATINGQNTLEIVAGENVTIDQKDGMLTVNATGGGSAGEVYSTEETRIGTWIDGKPLYRRVINNIKTPSQVSSSWESLYPVIEGIEVTRFEVYLFTMGSYVPTPIVTAAAKALCRFSYVYKSGASNYNGMYGICIYNTGAGYVNSPIFIVLEYTKTTDQAAIQTMGILDMQMEADNVAMSAITAMPVTSSVTESVSFDAKEETII